MKRVIWLIPAILGCVFCATGARAQEAPAWEVAGGYSYLRVNVKSPNYGLNGGYGSLTENLNSWFGGRIEVGAFTGAELGRSVSAETITYGPIFSTHKYQKITPFAELQLGVIHGSRGYLGISQDAFRFAMAPAVGIDLKINDRVAVRVQAESLDDALSGTRQGQSRRIGWTSFAFWQKIALMHRSATRPSDPRIVGSAVAARTVSRLDAGTHQTRPNGTRRFSRGFSLIELLIVVAMILIVAGNTIPNFILWKMRANETGAVANLRTFQPRRVVYSTYGIGYAPLLGRA